MYVSRIDLFGFKSFMDRTILPLGKGITAVVGPNGCGKSNVVDAIRWVLGETRAKSLRGDSLEDVIFNGTDKLRPLGLAEVSLTLKAEDGFFAELVSPAMEAELIAEGLDQLNSNVEASLNEASEALAVAEDSDDSDSDDNKTTPQQSKASFEHKYSWLKAATEVEVSRRVYRSGESEFFINKIPCRLRDIKDLCRAVGLAANGYTVVAQGEVSKLITSKPEQRRVILEEAAGVQGFREKISAASRRLEETALNITRIDDILREVGKQVQSLKRQASKAKSRDELKASILQADEIIFKHRFFSYSARTTDIEQNVEEYTKEEFELTEALKTKKEAEENLRSELIKFDSEGDDYRAKIDSIRNEINAYRQELMRKESEVAQARSQIEYRKNEMSRVQDQIKVLAQRKTSLESNIAGFVEEEKVLNAKIVEFDSENNEAILSELTKEISVLKDKLRNEEREWRELRDRWVQVKSRSEVLDQQVTTASPAAQIKQTLQNSGVSKDVLNKLTAFADALIVPQEYTKAIQALLDSKTAYLVAEDPHAFGKIFQDQRGNRKNAIGIFKANYSTKENLAQSELSKDILNLAQGSGLSLVSDSIKVQDHIQAITARLLQKAFFAKSLADAMKFFEGLNTSSVISESISDLVVVTLAGEVLTSHSYSWFNQEGGLIEMRSRLRALQEEQQGLGALYEEKTKQRDLSLESLKQKEQKYAELLQESQNRQKELRQLGASLGAVKGRLEADKRQINQAQQDIEKLNFQIVSAEEFVANKTTAMSGLETALAEVKSRDNQNLQTELKSIEAAYSQLETQRREKRQLLNAAAKDLESVRTELDKARQMLSDLSLKSQRVELERTDLLEKLEQLYGNELVRSWSKEASKESLLDDSSYRNTNEDLNKLKTRLVREGDVDPESVAQYEIEQARFDDLNKQKNDLEAASKSLKISLARLEEVSQKRFVETFLKVKKNFTTLIPKLFGGGSGELELTDMTKPLDSGLEIVVRPPGKKPKSLELLSGGEKAMCATALIMAMFMVRPSPLCILDEVDAPLDEANLHRFIGIIKEMSDRVQFMMITHNKQSMAAADSLWGITMQQPGATRILSASLQEAFQQVA